MMKGYAGMREECATDNMNFINYSTLRMVVLFCGNRIFWKVQSLVLEGWKSVNCF
jgi:hypothetical protein